jgi:hypothetical protein
MGHGPTITDKIADFGMASISTGQTIIDKIADFGMALDNGHLQGRLLQVK